MNQDNRRRFIDMAKRLSKAGSGSSDRVLRERSMEYGMPDVGACLGSVPFVIVGGLATRLYMPERMTVDTDVLVMPESLVEAERALLQAGCKKTGQLTIGRSTWHMPEGRNLDLIALEGEWVEKAIADPVSGPHKLPYVDLPYLVLMKLFSGRVQDLADISRMLGGADETKRRATRQVVKQYRPADLEDLDSLITLGQRELEEGGE